MIFCVEPLFIISWCSKLPSTLYNCIPSNQLEGYFRLIVPAEGFGKSFTSLLTFTGSLIPVVIEPTLFNTQLLGSITNPFGILFDRNLNVWLFAVIFTFTRVSPVVVCILNS